MNRRTFLKLTAAAMGLPALAHAKGKQQWILLQDQLPKKGQQIVMLDRWEGIMTCIRVGRVKTVRQPSLHLGKHLGEFITIDTDFALWHWQSNRHGSQHDTYEVTLNRNSANYSVNEILSTPWVKTKKTTDMPMGPVPFYSKSSNGPVWIPAPDRIPQILPPFPTLKKKQPPKYTLPGNRSRWFEYLSSENKNG